MNPLVTLRRTNFNSFSVGISRDIIDKLSLKKGDILSCSLKGNKIVYEKVEVVE